MTGTSNIFTKPDPKMTVAEACQRVLARYETGRNYATMAVNLNQIAALWGDRAVATVAGHEVSAWVDALRAAGCAPATINRKLSALNVVLKIARDEWGIKTQTIIIKRQKERNGRVRWLTAQEEEDLLFQAGKLDLDFHDLLVTLIDTGMRLSECLSLRLDNSQAVNYTQGTITLSETKTDVPRTIPMTDRVQDLFQARWSSNRTTWNLTVSQVEYMWSLVRRALKLESDKQFVIHALRHTFASRLVQAGVDLYRVSKLLGHSSIKTTERYAHLSPLDLRQAITALEVRPRRHTESPPPSCKP